jgi:predicted P-loop ATPase
LCSAVEGNSNDEERRNDNFLQMNIENYLRNKYDFKYNEILNRTFYKPKDQTDFGILQGYDFNSMFRDIQNNDIKVAIGNLKSLLESDFVPKYDPFKDYFTGLAKWDRKTDHINKLAKTVITTDEDLFYWAFKKWLVALVACALEPNTANHSVLIFTGKQGLGKTTWMMNLIPEKLKEYGYSGNINPSNKDSTILISERLLINMDELSSYSKSKVEAFKELITKEVITERRPYGYFSENYIRRASFCGSANHNEILMDVTGNRRFLVFEALDIDFDHGIDLDQVYSQAYELLQQGFKHYFDKDDIARIESNNEKYKQTSAEEEYLDKFFDLPLAGQENQVKYMNATEIIEYIKFNSKGYINFTATNLGKLLKSKGFETKKVDGLKKYIVSLK